MINVSPRLHPSLEAATKGWKYESLSQNTWIHFPVLPIVSYELSGPEFLHQISFLPKSFPQTLGKFKKELVEMR